MKLTYLLPIGAGAVALYFWSKAQAGKNIKVYLSGLSLSKGTNAIPDIFTKFRIVNGSNTPVTLKSIVGDVYVNDKQIASVSNTDSFLIPSNKEVYYSVKLSPNVFTILTIVTNLIKAKQRIKVTFSGTINTTGVMIPINETIFQQN
jgi:LEA14-like dessication related protein